MTIITTINQALMATQNQVLDLTDVDLVAKSYHREAIYELITTSGVQAILLENNGFSNLRGEDRTRLLEHINKASQLTYLRLCGNTQPDFQSIAVSLQGLRAQKSLKYLDLSNNFLGACPNTTLISLVRALKNIPQLTHLDVSNNGLSAEQIALIQAQFGTSSVLINVDPETPIHQHCSDLAIPAPKHPESPEQVQEKIGQYHRDRIIQCIRRSPYNISDYIEEAKQHCPHFFENQENCSLLLVNILSKKDKIASLSSIERITSAIPVSIIYQFLHRQPEVYNIESLPVSQRMDLLKLAVRENNRELFTVYWDALPEEKRRESLDGNVDAELQSSSGFNFLINWIVVIRINREILRDNIGELYACSRIFGPLRAEAALLVKLSTEEDPDKSFQQTLLSQLTNGQHSVDSDAYVYLLTLIVKNGLLSDKIRHEIQQNTRVKKHFEKIDSDLAGNRILQLTPPELKQFIETCESEKEIVNQTLLQKVITANNPELIVALLTRIPATAIGEYFTRRVTFNGNTLTLRDFLLATPANGGLLKQLWPTMSAVLLAQSIDQHINAVPQSRFTQLKQAMGDDILMDAVINYLRHEPAGTYGQNFAEQILFQIPLIHPRYAEFFQAVNNAAFKDRALSKIAYAYLNAFSNHPLVPPLQESSASTDNSVLIANTRLVTESLLDSWNAFEDAEANTYFKILPRERKINLFDYACCGNRSELMRQFWLVMDADAQKAILTDDAYEHIRKTLAFESLCKDLAKTRKFLSNHEVDYYVKMQKEQCVAAVKRTPLENLVKGSAVAGTAIDEAHHLAVKYAHCFVDIMDYLKDKYLAEIKGCEMQTDNPKWKNYCDRLDHIQAILEFIDAHRDSTTLGADLLERIGRLKQPSTNRGVRTLFGTSDNYKHLLDNLKEVATKSPDILVFRMDEIRMAIINRYPFIATKISVSIHHPFIELYQRLRLGAEAVINHEVSAKSAVLTAEELAKTGVKPLDRDAIEAQIFEL